MKWYRTIAIINTVLFFIVCFLTWWILAEWSHNMRTTIYKMAGESGLPYWTEVVFNMYKFIESSVFFPGGILMLWIFGNILFLEFLFRKKTDKIEFLLLHVECLIAQLLLYFIMIMFICGALYMPFHIMMIQIGIQHQIIKIDKILAISAIFLIIIGFILTRLLYRRRNSSR